MASGTSKAGYMTLSEALKEVIFMRQVQDFIESSMRVLHGYRRTGLGTFM